MRRERLCLAVLMAFGVACGDDATSSNATAASSAGGSGGGGDPGAGGTSTATAGAAGSGGAGGSCAPDGTATVTFALVGSPLDGHVVVFQRGDGSVASETATDATGNASGTVPCDGMVTVAFSDALLLTLRVQPGDAIVLDESPPDLSGVGDMHLDAAENFASASKYLVGCPGPGFELSDLTAGSQFAIRKYCLNGAG